MNDLLASLRTYLDAHSRKYAHVFTYGLALAGLILAIVASLVPLDVVRVVAGAAAGVVWFVAGYTAWYELLPANLRLTLNIRERWDAPRRCRWAIILLGVWLLLLVIGRDILNHAGALVGSINVALLITFMLTATLTPGERATELARYDAEIAAREQAVQEAAEWAASNPVPEEPARRARGLRRLLGL